MCFSVVIPLFNKEASITSTIQSVLDQTYPWFELIVVDDGSTDRSRSMVEAIDDKRIRLICQPNNGVSSARNTGIKAANFDLIASLDGDDLWRNTFLVSMKCLVDDFPEAGFFGCQFVNDYGSWSELANAIHSTRGYIDNFFRLQPIAPIVCASSVVIRKACFERIGYFDEKFSRGEDLDMWSRLAKNYRVAFEPAVLSIYRRQAENRASDNSPPLDKFYYEHKFNGMSYRERRWHLRIAGSVLWEMLNKRRFVDAARMIGVLNVNFPLVIFDRMRSHFESRPTGERNLSHRTG